MGDTNTNNSANNVDAVTALTNAATIRKLLRLPNEDGKTNFEIIQVRSISELSNGHNCEVTIRVDLAFGHEGLPVPENERYSVRTETVRRIDLKDVAKLAGLELNDKHQYVGAATDVAAVAALLKANLTEDDITVSPIKDVMWVRAKPDSVGFIGMLTFAEGGEVAPVEKLPTAINATLSASEVVIGEKVTATIEVLPADAANKAITVVSSDPTIATVNADGTEITGVKEGNVTITYTSTAAPTVKAEKPLLVKPQPVVKPTGINVENAPAEMTVSEAATVEVSIEPAEADQGFTATSSNPDLLTLSENGTRWNAFGDGDVVVEYVSTAEPPVKVEKAVKINPVLPLGILVDVASEVTAGQSVTATVTVNPPETKDKSFSVVANDPTLVDISADGLTITGILPGEVILTYTCNADTSIQQTVTLNVLAILPNAINVTGVPTTIISGESKSGIQVVVEPDGAHDKSYTVSSSNQSIVAVNQDGTTLTADAVGTATINYVSVANPEVSAEFDVEVTPSLPTSFEILNMPSGINIGETVSNIGVTVLPNNATNKTYTVTSDKPAILTVTANGNSITGVAAGAATITYVANANNDVIAKFGVFVSNPAPTEINLDNASKTMTVGETQDITVGYIPTYAMKGVTATSDNLDVLTVTSDGSRWVAVAEGVANVTYTSTTNPETKTTVAVTVNPVPPMKLK